MPSAGKLFQPLPTAAKAIRKLGSHVQPTPVFRRTVNFQPFDQPAMIAAHHNVQVTDGDFQKAEEIKKSAARNPAQYMQEMGRKPSQQETTKPRLFPGLARGCNLLHP